MRWHMGQRVESFLSEAGLFHGSADALHHGVQSFLDGGIVGTVQLAIGDHLTQGRGGIPVLAAHVLNGTVDVLSSGSGDGDVGGNGLVGR